MKRISILLVIVILAGTTTFAATRPAGPPPGPPPQQQQGPGPGEILTPQQLAEFLDLTEAQIAQIAPLRETLRTTVQPLREQQRENGEKLRDAVEAGDAATAGQMAIANHLIGQQIKAAADAFKTAFEGLLTSEQKSKLAIYEEIVEIRARRGPRE